MNYKKFYKTPIASLGMAFLLCSNAAIAHPHNWIELRTQINIDERGYLTGFSQHWSFDQFFSMISYAEMMNEYHDEPLGLTSTAMKMVANVAPDSYLSELKVAGEVIALPVPKGYTLESVVVNGNPILVLKMNFILSEPRLVKGKKITLKTFEPSYFIAMNYPSPEHVRIAGNALHCTAQLIRANPSEALIDYAISLDRSVKETQGLGGDFAERVTIQC